MVGIPGAGKSTFAEHFAKTFQAPFINAKTLQFIGGLTPEATDDMVDLMLDEIMKTGRTLVYEGPTDTRASRMAIARRVSAMGYQPLFIWVQTESAEAQRRSTRKRRDGISMTDEEFDKAIQRFNPPTAQDKPVVISGKHTYTTQLKIVLKRLATEQRPGDDEPRPRSARNIILR